MDTYLKEVFPEPPLVAYKKQKSIKDYLVRAKVPTKMNQRPRRTIPGMTKCKKYCQLCPYVMEGRVVKGNNVNWKINKSVNCETHNVVYLIECDKCKMHYIGESERNLRDRISEHKTYIRTNKLNQPTGEHFNRPGHSLANLKITILEQMKTDSTLYRKERESYLIRKFDSYNRGMNKSP